MRTKGTLAAITLGLITYCSSASSDVCELVAGNLLQDPMFIQRNPTGVFQYWASSQHAGEPSFELEFDSGELTINKTGTQPWFYFRQNIAVEQLVGKKLALTAELKLDMEPQQRRQGFVVGGGIKMVARSSSLQGRKLLLRSVLDHEPHAGKTDWYPVQVVIELPKGSSTLDVGFLHQADGTLQVRNPSLQLVDESRMPCAISPNAILGVPQATSGLR
jgi:hypothetical protein